MTTEKISTLIIESNLECGKCHRKIQKVLCKLQDKEKIRTINFDTKSNTVTISGPFDPLKLICKLKCKAGYAIKDIKIKPEPKKEDKKEEEKEEKKPEKTDEKKKPAEGGCCNCCKKPDDKKPAEEKKKTEETKKPEVTKTEDKPKPPKEEPKAAPSSTTVNLQFTQVCNVCYPWPCSDPSHWGGVHQHPKPQPAQPQWPCEPPTAFPGHQHQPYPPWAAPMTPKRQPCGGLPYCGGCGSCGGGYNGWPPAMPTPLQMMQPPPMAMGCGGPASSCRGCKGCRIVQEGRFIYEEYPQNSCSVM